MKRVRLVVGNWKMNPATADEAIALARAVAAAPRGGASVGIAPPTTALAAVASVTGGSGVAIYAQDVHWELRGAFTGQVSVTMLRGLAAGAIVGHSEVRRDQGDDDARVARKVARALQAGLQVILCVGETEAQFAAGETDVVLRAQIEQDVARAGALSGGQLVVAYEPIWAIGTGRPATAGHATGAARTIRSALGAAGAPADDIRILYGGSVGAANATELAAAEGIDGALVGGASLVPDDFAAIIRAFGT